MAFFLFQFLTKKKNLFENGRRNRSMVPQKCYESNVEQAAM